MLFFFFLKLYQVYGLNIFPPHAFLIIHLTFCGASPVGKAMPQSQLFFEDFPKEAFIMEHLYVQYATQFSHWNYFQQLYTSGFAFVAVVLEMMQLQDPCFYHTRGNFFWSGFYFPYPQCVRSVSDQDTSRWNVFAVVSSRWARFQESWGVVGKVVIWQEPEGLREEENQGAIAHTQTHTHTLYK